MWKRRGEGEREREREAKSKGKEITSIRLYIMLNKMLLWLELLESLRRKGTQHNTTVCVRVDLFCSVCLWESTTAHWEWEGERSCK